MSDTSTPAEASPPTRWLPWHSATLGWGVAILTVIVGVPLFMCMPPWPDVTLYDMAARAVLRGGVHYRDVFDTNLPGIVWLMAGIRAALGWSYEAMRAVDLLIIAAEIWLLVWWIRRTGAPRYTIAWFVAAAVMFYLSTSEFSHMQRDPWLLLPALIAARLRVTRVERSGSENPVFRRGVLEGTWWGCAVWIKPHVVVPAFALWVVSAVLCARKEPGSRIRKDLAGLLLGGALVGAAGIAWLVASGTWPYFLDVVLKWNPNYIRGVLPGAAERLVECIEALRPWGLLYLAALPLAVVALWEARAFSSTPGEPRKVHASPRIYLPADTELVAGVRAMFAAFFLGWFAQTIVLQKGFEYVQVPLLLMVMAMVAMHRWCFGFVYLVWFLFLAVLLNFTNLVSPDHYPPPGNRAIRLEHTTFTNPRILKLWPRCWREGGTPELRDSLRQYGDIFCSMNWENLTDVARFLKTIDPPLGPHELNCWHDTTHPLYLMLDLEPATRFMHYGTVFSIQSENNWIQKQIVAEVAGSPQRYVVSDLSRMTNDPRLAYAPGAGGDPHRLPRWFPLSQRGTFPWNQPIVFRSGRYLVHKVVNPMRAVSIPDWTKLDELGPGETLP
jgi:hypothetical protein